MLFSHVPKSPLIHTGDCHLAPLPNGVPLPPSLPVARFSHLDGLRDCSNLVDLEQQAVAGLGINRLLDALGVGAQQVISNNLRLW